MFIYKFSKSLRKKKSIDGKFIFVYKININLQIIALWVVLLDYYNPFHLLAFI